jgi:hypothetical protein
MEVAGPKALQYLGLSLWIHQNNTQPRMTSSVTVGIAEVGVGWAIRVGPHAVSSITTVMTMAMSFRAVSSGWLIFI